MRYERSALLNLKFAAIQSAFAFSFVALLIIMSRHSALSGRAK